MYFQPVRSHSTLVVDPEATYDFADAGEYRCEWCGFAKANSPVDPYRSIAPSNAAEKALHELDIYKRPLLPTRLRMQSSQGTTPELLRQKKVHVPVPMRRRHGEEEDKPRLGMKPNKGGKPLKERKVNEAKPYAGEGGMKKMLARRRQEEDQVELAQVEVLTNDDDDRMIDEEEERVQKAKKEKREEKAKEVVGEIPSPPRVDAPFAPDHFAPLAAGVSAGTSSLRVGRQKQSRMRPEAPRPRKAGAARFSAIAEEGEEDVPPSPEKTPAKPRHEAPAGFSFAPPTVSLLFSPDTSSAFLTSFFSGCRSCCGRN
jgi:nucleoporin NUP1